MPLMSHGSISHCTTAYNFPQFQCPSIQTGRTLSCEAHSSNSVQRRNGAANHSVQAAVTPTPQLSHCIQGCQSVYLRRTDMRHVKLSCTA